MHTAVGFLAPVARKTSLRGMNLVERVGHSIHSGRSPFEDPGNVMLCFGRGGVIDRDGPALGRKFGGKLWRTTSSENQPGG